MVEGTTPQLKAVTIRLLGPLRVTIGEAELDLSTPMHRALMAILAVNANAVVSTEQLIDEMWQRDPPDGARATLQSYVSVLRSKCKELGHSALIETRSPGYVLRVRDAEVDVAQFRSHIAAARHAEAGGVPAEAGEHLGAALALVDDNVLADLDHLDTVRVFVADIDEQWRWATHHLAELELSAGRGGEVVAMLRDGVRRHPLQERTWSLLMRALHQSGRQADALRAYQDLRVLLRDELGVEPGSEVKAVERAVLAGPDEDVSVVQQPRVPARRTARAPHPRTPLVGRIQELVDLENAIASHRLVTITGPGG